MSHDLVGPPHLGTAEGCLKLSYSSSESLELTLFAPSRRAHGGGFEESERAEDLRAEVGQGK